MAIAAEDAMETAAKEHNTFVQKEEKHEKDLMALREDVLGKARQQVASAYEDKSGKESPFRKHKMLCISDGPEGSPKKKIKVGTPANTEGMSQEDIDQLLLEVEDKHAKNPLFVCAPGDKIPCKTCEAKCGYGLDKMYGPVGLHFSWCFKCKECRHGFTTESLDLYYSHYEPGETLQGLVILHSGSSQ